MHTHIYLNTTDALALLTLSSMKLGDLGLGAFALLTLSSMKLGDLLIGVLALLTLSSMKLGDLGLGALALSISAPRSTLSPFTVLCSVKKALQLLQKQQLQGLNTWTSEGQVEEKHE